MTYFKETNADSSIKRPIFLVINSQLFLLYNFSKFLYIFTLFIHPSTLNITNKTPHCPDDGSAESKRYSVDWLCFSINPYFLFGLFVVNFSSQIVGLLSIIFFHIYIYIYIYYSSVWLSLSHLVGLWQTKCGIIWRVLNSCDRAVGKTAWNQWSQISIHAIEYI